MVKNTANCFIIMPFSKAESAQQEYPKCGKDELDNIYELIKKCAELHGYSTTRSSDKGDILAGVIKNLDAADLLIADLTSLNPNVMYELGVRHAFMKPTIMITQSLNELPFDLRNYHVIEYKWTTKQGKAAFQKAVSDVISEIKSGADILFGPVHTYLGTKNFALREHDRETARNKFVMMRVELNKIVECIMRTFFAVAEASPDLFIATTVDGQTSISPNFEVINIDAECEIFIKARERWPHIFPCIDYYLASWYYPRELVSSNGILCVGAQLLRLRDNLHTIPGTYGGLFSLFNNVNYVNHDVGMLTIALNTGVPADDKDLHCIELMNIKTQGVDIPVENRGLL